MGCGCSMTEDELTNSVPKSTSNGQKGNTRTKKNEDLEFSHIPSKDIDLDVPTSVYCPPPPDWALNENGLEKKNINPFKIIQSKTSNSTNPAKNGLRKNPWYKLIDEAKNIPPSTTETAEITQYSNNHLENGRNEIVINANHSDLTVEKEDIVITVSQSEDSQAATDALSRPRSVHTIPTTLSDPGPLDVVGHKVPFNQHRKKHSRQLAVDDHISVYSGQYSTLV